VLDPGPECGGGGAPDRAALAPAGYVVASVGDVEALRAPQGCGCPAVVDPGLRHHGWTYGNECEARGSGWVAVAHPGPCAGDP
jgi:hypothetical protein